MKGEKLETKIYHSFKLKRSYLSLISAKVIKPAVMITLITGIYLHLTRLFIDTDLLIKYIYTATFDAIFAIPMIIGAITIIPSWKYFIFKNKFEKVITFVTGVYFIVSLPLHFQTWISQSTDYIRIFPMWYSYLFLVYTTVMLYIWYNIKIEI